MRRTTTRWTIDAAAIRPTVTWGINPGQSVCVDESLPQPADVPTDPTRRGRRGARVHGVRARARRSRARGSTSRSSARAPTRGCRICARRRASCAGRHVAPHVRALVVPGSQAVRLAAEREGLDRVFIDAGFDWRGAGCSMCLAMNPGQARRPRDLRLVVEPQLQGPAGQPDRAHAADEPGDGGRGRGRRRSRGRAGVRADGRLRRFVEIARDARCRCAATTSTPIGSSPRGSCKSITFEGLEQHLFEDDRKQLEAAGSRHPHRRPDATPARRSCW